MEAYIILESHKFYFISIVPLMSTLEHNSSTVCYDTDNPNQPLKGAYRRTKK